MKNSLKEHLGMLPIILVPTLIAVNKQAEFSNRLSTEILHEVTASRVDLAHKLARNFSCTVPLSTNWLPKIKNNASAQAALHACTVKHAQCEQEPLSELYQVDGIRSAIRAEINHNDLRKKANAIRSCEITLEQCISSTVMPLKKR